MRIFFVGFPWRGPQTTVGWSEPATISNFGRHIFKTSRAEANIIMRRHEVLYRLSIVTLKCLTLNDLEMPFYAEICSYRRFY